MSSFPDLMNDPAFDGREKGFDDMDTCRICHGEATDEEPLFYPCKCSGSIKFVHQSCLVEWLSHSQKKHCELCKTAFRFTKLYDPHMPETLPTPVFLKQALIRCFRTLVTWLRFFLVGFVWLGWLPWSMRAIWRALFWLADGRWSASARVAQSVANGTSSGLTDMTSTASSTANTMPSAQSSTSGFPPGDPLILALIKKVIPSLFLPALTSTVGQDGSGSTRAASTPKPRHPSWLSDVKCLNNFSSPTINNMIIDTLEGLIITLVVQPMANIAEGEREAALQLIANANNRVIEQAQAQAEAEAERAEPERIGRRDEPIQLGHEIRSDTASPAPSWSDSDDGLPVLERVPESLHDTFAAGNIVDPDRPVPQDPRTIAALRVMDVTTRSNGDRAELHRIIHEEGLQEEMAWLLDIVNREEPTAEAAEDTRIAENLQDALLDVDNDTTTVYERPVDETNAFDDPQQVEESSIIPQSNIQAPKGAVERLTDWFWGDIPNENGFNEELPEHDNEHIVPNADPFPPVPDRLEDPAANQVMAADAGLDGNDIDAIEGDDFDGIMDLIGMQGPIFGLLQNGVFCALLIAFTVAIGIWLPYLWGKIALVLLANPVELIVGVPMTAVTVVADIALDTLIGALGYIMYTMTSVFRLLSSPFSSLLPAVEWIPRGKFVATASLSLIDSSAHRLNKVGRAFLVFHESDIPMFSVLSHQALKLHQARLLVFFQSTFAVFKFVLHDFPLRLVTLGVPGALTFDLDAVQLKSYAIHIQEQLVNFTKISLFSSPRAKLMMDASAAKAASATLPVDYDLVTWDTKDRAIAISMGYLLATVMGFLYLRITGLLAGPNRGQRVDGIVGEVLLQAAGVMKVILIIGIEMIVFPLYCGSLLDLALLPLFSDTTVASRIAFTASSPLTSLFIHWFVGTCYMFHFALFVSMCRKILRNGVLYFIRDPDDPTFHPIRDVLERSITTQLRKIGFSALVYGALVIIFLGGVVWGLHFSSPGILPIHWSASAPMLEFPVDLLFYNFVMPLAIQSVNPSDGLHEMYDWWFHKCAHFLRLSNFFFEERHPEEEGCHVRRSWWSLLSGAQGDWKHPIIGPEERANADREARDVYFLRDGRYVRAPASDQVRIPKGTLVFLEVTEGNERVDGKPDLDDGLHGRSSTMFAKVYVPPKFWTRISAFIILIWFFTAISGVGITVIPLVVGRKLISSCFPNPAPVNDIYAFSSGLFLVSSFFYTACYCRTAISSIREQPEACLLSPQQLARFFVDLALVAVRLIYISITLVVLLPCLFALLTELYILIPAHTLIGDGQSHVVHVVQDWTLGVLYVQMAIKLTLWHPDSWPAAVLNGIFRDGWLKPNVKLATRALIVPISLLTAVATIVPLLLGGIFRCSVFYSHESAQPNVYRYAYPATLLFVLVSWTIYLLHRRVAIWRINLRDEVYLIGERLHNLSEKRRAPDVGVSSRVITG
ncbi:Zinc finger RING-CH-type [Penicillium taxi]|uniref:Zinc finger RING-CH-type n=1 Tax=Penicillium taxi TaxID=168475 RepID=UPI0025450461|nr:Zinc finger RING-CH-type [Penicillium taxi]KAJ5888706.1 Zinc finger RING-CH-type [Penicillium taxi]